MAAYTEVMKWYSLGADMAPRTKYHFNIEIYSSQAAQYARQIYNCVRTVELPKYSIDTQVVNAWNVQQLVPTKVVFEPLSITFNDTLDNRFQKFLKSYLAITTNSFQSITSGFRTEFDGFGLRLQDTVYDVVIEKIVIRRFYGADAALQNFGEQSIVTLYRPKIIDVQHDTLDYSASEAITWQISVRYESMTYEEIPGPPGTQPESQSEITPIGGPPLDQIIPEQLNNIPEPQLLPLPAIVTNQELVKQSGIGGLDRSRLPSAGGATGDWESGIDTPIRGGGGTFDGGGASGSF